MTSGMDISNYTSPLTQAQLAYVQDNMDWVCIGLQDAAKARAFKAQLQPLGVELQYYIERPGRDLSIPDAGSIVWVDIETGCFTERVETLTAIDTVINKNLTLYIYGNKWSIEPVFGNSTELSGYPLVHAEYPADGHVPDITEFKPYNGWTKPTIWQYSSGGVAGINADLCVGYDMTETGIRHWTYGDEAAGEEVVGNQIFVWHRGVVINKIGDEAGLYPGKRLHNEGGVFVEKEP